METIQVLSSNNGGTAVEILRWLVSVFVAFGTFDTCTFYNYVKEVVQYTWIGFPRQFVISATLVQRLS